MHADPDGARSRLPSSTGSGHGLSRRQVLGGGAALALWLASGCTDAAEQSSSPVDDATASTATSGVPATDGEPVASRPLTRADFEGLGTCVLLPETTAGPFPTTEQLDRRDITEGSPGRPLRLGLRVVDEACTAVPGVAVEVWHADASGDYSAYEDGGTGKDEGAGTTFLRGSRTADDEGVVEFATIYPGWYRGRAVHIHVRVRRDDELVVTSQLFLPEARTAAVLSGGAYREFGPPDTTNATDALGGDIESNGTLLHVSEASTAPEPDLVALLNLGVPA